MDKKGLELLHKIWRDSEKSLWTTELDWSTLTKEIYNYLKENGTI